MSELTPVGFRELVWGPFPELRKALREELVPEDREDPYPSFSWERTERYLDIARTACARREDVLAAQAELASWQAKRQLGEDLYHLCVFLARQERVLRDVIHEVERLMESLERAS